MSDSDDFLKLLQRDGVASASAALTPLTGGVSSEIYLLADGNAPPRVVKRALARLKVKEEWLADVSRNRFERLYLQYVRAIRPDAVPAVERFSDAGGYFLMEYLGEGFSNWKQLLLADRSPIEHARRAGEILGTIHHRSAGDAEARDTFDTTANFFQLRIEPYLLTTGRRNPALQGLFETEAVRLAETRLCLVHGDFSPKNILVTPGRLVLLDCEVAWYGDPAFDVAFLLNHLFLKARYRWPGVGELPAMIEAFWTSYLGAIDPVLRSPRLHSGAHPDMGEAPMPQNNDLEARVGRLLLMLMLARVDGKSPVEYLNDSQRRWVRQFVPPRLRAGRFSLDLLLQDWLAGLAKD